jgi:ABC-2 type transport system permease protein
MTASIATGNLHDALSPVARPAPPSRLSTVGVFAWRALLKLRHVPEQMADAIIIPVIFTLMFTYLFGGALSGSTAAYLQELLPGTLVLTVLLVTVYTGLVLKTDLDRGILDRFRSMPLWRPALIAGSLLGDAGRYLVATTVVIGMGLLMGFRPAGGITGVVLAIALVLLFAYSLSWIWTTLALLLRTPTTLSMASFVVQFPLTFASNVFVDPATMPAWLRAFVEANPVSHLVTTERALMDGTATAGQVVGVLLAALAVSAVFAPLTMHLYRTQR